VPLLQTVGHRVERVRQTSQLRRRCRFDANRQIPRRHVVRHLGHASDGPQHSASEIDRPDGEQRQRGHQSRQHVGRRSARGRLGPPLGRRGWVLAVVDQLGEAGSQRVHLAVAPQGGGHAQGGLGIRFDRANLRHREIAHERLAAGLDPPAPPTLPGGRRPTAPPPGPPLGGSRRPTALPHYQPNPTQPTDTSGEPLKAVPPRAGERDRLLRCCRDLLWLFFTTPAILRRSPVTIAFAVNAASVKVAADLLFIPAGRD
jgi:hypothetical protein